MFTIYLNDLSVTVQRGSLPSIYNDLKRHAQLADEFALRPHDGELCFLSVSSTGHWPFLVVAQRFELSEGGFDPGAMVVPETRTLFLGAGRRLLCYRLDPPKRLWEETTDAGFLEWSRHGDVVLMSGELELIAWDMSGARLWSMPLEPAWEYHVTEGQVHLDVQGRRSTFPVRAGPQQAALEH
jgi:hypothetical protein